MILTENLLLKQSIDMMIKVMKQKEIFISLTGSLDSKWTFKYDDRGNTIEENIYNSNGSLNSKITYRYNDKNIIEEAYNWRSKETYKYECDDKGNWIKRISYTNNQPNIITKRTIEYY